MDYNDLQYVYWLSSLTTMYIDDGKNSDQVAGIASPERLVAYSVYRRTCVGKLQNSRRIPTHHRGALPWSSTLEGPSFAANILNKKNTDIGLLQYFLKPKVTRHVRHVSHSIVMAASKARLSNQNCLDLSSWQCQVCSCEDPPVLGTCSKQHKKTNAARLSCIFRSWVIEAVMELTKDL